jgi:hypothetical protein
MMAMSSSEKPTTQPEQRWPKLSTDQKQAVLNQYKSIQDEEALAQQKPVTDRVQ